MYIDREKITLNIKNENYLRFVISIKYTGLNPEKQIQKWHGTFQMEIVSKILFIVFKFFHFKITL